LLGLGASGAASVAAGAAPAAAGAITASTTGFSGLFFLAFFLSGLFFLLYTLSGRKLIFTISKSPEPGAQPRRGSRGPRVHLSSCSKHRGQLQSQSRHVRPLAGTQQRTRGRKGLPLKGTPAIRGSHASRGSTHVEEDEGRRQQEIAGADQRRTAGVIQGPNITFPLGLADVSHMVSICTVGGNTCFKQIRSAVLQKNPIIIKPWAAGEVISVGDK